MKNVLTLREVATALGVTEIRVYQMDDVLSPLKIPRGKRGKMVTRLYMSESVQRELERRHQVESAALSRRS
jgi:hypothetical protein